VGNPSTNAHVSLHNEEIKNNSIVINAKIRKKYLIKGKLENRLTAKT
jgi:hypothetical protein